MSNQDRLLKVINKKIEEIDENIENDNNGIVDEPIGFQRNNHFESLHGNKYIRMGLNKSKSITYTPVNLQPLVD